MFLKGCTESDEIDESLSGLFLLLFHLGASYPIPSSECGGPPFNKHNRLFQLKFKDSSNIYLIRRKQNVIK